MNILRTCLLVAAFVFSAAFLGGCATRWTKPGFDLNAWQVDYNNCIIQSSRLFPPQYHTSTIYTVTSPIETNCERIGTYVSCSTTGGESHPITVTEDLSRGNRDKAWESCIRALGYYPVEEKKGAISEAEHKRAKEKIAPTQTDNTDTDKKLQELDELRKSGVLSEEDYNKAKKRLSETQKLNELRQSGVLSEEEYNKAKARLTGK